MIPISKNDVEVKKIDFVSKNESKSMILNNQKGSGLTLINGLKFKEGTIVLELKGEKKHHRSFVGLEFNIKNDST